MTTEIRQLTTQDIPDAVCLLGKLNPDVPDDVLKCRLETILADHPNYRIVGLFHQGLLAGVCGAWIATKLWCGKYLEIDNLVVDPAFRGMGFGSRLIGHFESIAKDAGCNVLTLDSYAENHDSHRLYQRHGFEPWSIHFINPFGNWKGSPPP